MQQCCKNLHLCCCATNPISINYLKFKTMKDNKKSKLSDLKFKSYVTALDSEATNKLKGGVKQALCDTEDIPHCIENSETTYCQPVCIANTNQR